MEQLYKRRVSVSFGSFFDLFKAGRSRPFWVDYPFCKLIIYRDRFALSIPFSQEHTIFYSDIDYIKRHLHYGISIYQKNSDVVYVSSSGIGPSLYKDIISIVAEHNLNIKVI